MAGTCANQVSADWYSNDPKLNQSQGYGDFPPATIEQDLQKKLDEATGAVEHQYQSQPFRDSNPWDQGQAPVDRVVRQHPVSNVQNNSKAPEPVVPAPQPASSPLGNIYQPGSYPVSNYGTYNPGMVGYPRAGSSPGLVGGPWNSRGSGYQGPWNNTNSSFSPWGGRSGSRNGNNPFGVSGPGGWFN